MFSDLRAIKVITKEQKPLVLEKSNSLHRWPARALQSSRASCSIETETLTSMGYAKAQYSHEESCAHKSLTHTWFKTLLLYLEILNNFWARDPALCAQSHVPGMMVHQQGAPTHSGGGEAFRKRKGQWILGNAAKKVQKSQIVNWYMSS